MDDEKTALRFDMGAICIPGDKIVFAGQKYAPGMGTYKKKGAIYASVAGKLSQQPVGNHFLLHVIPRTHKIASVLRTGQVVLARCIRKTPRQAFLEVCADAVGDVLPEPRSAVLNPPDAVNPTLMPWKDCIQPHDIVLVEILAVDERLTVSILPPHLGVVYATHQGQRMYPVAWNCVSVKDGDHQEPRKCAKPPNVAD